MKFVENNRYEWMKRNTAPTTCKRRITSNFYATVKKLKVVKIDIYPSPIIYDKATTEGQCFVKAISPGDDSGSSSSSNSIAEKKRKLKN